MPMSKWLLMTLQWLSEAWELRSHLGATKQLGDGLQSAKSQQQNGCHIGTTGLHPKDILTTPPPLGPEQAPFRPALTREPGEIPSQSPDLSKPCLMTKKVKATNAQQTFA